MNIFDENSLREIFEMSERRVDVFEKVNNIGKIISDLIKEIQEREED